MEYLTLYTSPYSKKRIGKNNDGGYVIVELPGRYDIFLSGGISDDISFENHLLSLYPELTCHAFDGTINYTPNGDRIVYHRQNLGNTNNLFLTNLDQYFQKYNDIFLKIDIEGHEFRLLPVVELSKVKQLVVEIHSPGDIQLYPDYFRGLSDITNNVMFNLLEKINNTHTLVHLHANNGCKMQKINGIDVPHVFELTYIRNEFVDTRIKNTLPLPTSLDMKNIVGNPDYILSGFPYSA